MDILTLLGVVALAGGLGGALNGWQINFLRSDLDKSDPALEQLKDPKAEEILKQAIETPTLEKVESLLFNIAAGAVAAAVSWSAYGPYALMDIFAGASPENVLTLTSLAAALITGLGGTRWLTNERDKSLLKQAAENAAVECSETGSKLARDLLPNASPKQAVRVSRAIKGLNL